MKHMSKILALVLALVMILGLAITANAAEGDIEISVTTSDSGASVAGHTYEVYQIFTGDVAEDGKTLSNAKFGANYQPEGKTVKDAMEEISAMSPTAAAAFLAGAVTEEAIAELNDENGHKTEVAPGYYLIVDVTEGKNLEDGETTSAFILQVLQPTEIKSKHSAGPIVEKKIDDKNDSNTSEDEIEWHDSADHDIGDPIDFKLEMTVPAIISQFKEYKEAYKFVFHDTEEKGLTFQPTSVVVKLDGEKITSGYELVYPAEDGHTFDVVFADLTAIEGLDVGSVVTVEYKSQLNQEAVLGSQGNVNKVFGEYSNLHDDENPGFTPEDAVIAFTYKVVVNKVDESEKPLPGAEFTLEKYDAATESWIAIEVVKTEADTVFTFKGLDDGDYRLTETVTPDGYNTIDPIEFTVTADHEILWTMEREDVLTSLTGEVTTGEIEFTADVAEGSLSADVINQAGIELPETGGIGTTIFYILGGLLAVGAVVLLVTKKRMASAE